MSPELHRSIGCPAKQGRPSPYSEGPPERGRKPQVRGFTLLEVMLGLALLGIALVVLIRSAAGSIHTSEESHMMGIATDLARGKMYDIEELLMKDGFTDTDQSQMDLKPFEQEGWPTIYYAYKVQQVEMPDFDTLQKMGSAAGSGSGHGGSAFSTTTYGTGSLGSGSALFGSDSPFGSAFGSNYGALGSNAFGSALGSGDALTQFQNSALGGVFGMMGGGDGGGGGSGNILGAQGGALIQAQYQMFQQILKVTVRKVTLVVAWKVLGSDRNMKVVAFFTDPAAMDQVINGLGAVDIGDGSGSGSSGSGAATKTATPVKSVSTGTH